MKKKVCVFTGTRAEYGLLRPLMQELKTTKEIETQIVVSGMHLSPEFGLTYSEIENDGFIINERIEILLSSDSTMGINKSIGLGIISFGEAIDRLKPDINIILGDRFEALAFAVASTVARIPIAHIHGGETTEGAIDEAFRHAITKMSHLHFTSTDEHRKRVIQLGEHPERVFNVGALGIDNIKKMELLSRDSFEKSIDFKLNKRNLLVTYHPVTLEDSSSEEQFGNLLNVLDELIETAIIFTKPNADTDGRIIIKMIDEYVAKNKMKSVAFTSMGQLRYLSALQFVDAVVGNSSSGIIEAPSFQIGSVNIGDRQKGRIAAESVIQCEVSTDSIQKAFLKLYSIDFQSILESVENFYGVGNTALRIKEIIEQYNLNGIIKKAFCDINFQIR